MAVIPVVWLHYDAGSPCRGYWDQALIDDLLTNRMWRTGYEFEHHEWVGGFEHGVVEGAVVVLPARAQGGYIDQINADLASLKWVLLILTGDEASVFPVEQVRHSNIYIWVMSPRPGRHSRYSPIGTGYPPQQHQLLPKVAPEKTLDWFFAGQVTNDRRELCGEQLKNLSGGQYHPSPGFTLGLSPEDYMRGLASAKVAPCPSGPCTPDTFRLFEALEAGCVPIADTRTSAGDFPDHYWTYFFGQTPPFPTLTDYGDLHAQIGSAVAQYPALNNKIFAWWQRCKYEMAMGFAKQIAKLTGHDRDVGDVTVIMSSSPIASHPSTAMIEETIRTVRHHLPDSEIFIMLDGVRPELQERKADYEEYQRQLLWLCNYRWDNVLPLRHEGFLHQSGMTPGVLDIVKTPMILFVEHDTPLTDDFPIEWDGCFRAIRSGAANVIRFHHESFVLEEHKEFMFGEVEEVEGVKLWRTQQWSQRPHLASAAFYREMLARLFRVGSRAFIEHGVYGELAVLCDVEGMAGWEKYKLWMYHPDGIILRSRNLDGRGGSLNFESIF